MTRDEPARDALRQELVSAAVRSDVHHEGLAVAQAGDGGPSARVRYQILGQERFGLDLAAGFDEIGIDRIMWGSDYPHREGTYPYSREALRQAFHGWDEAKVRRTPAEWALR